MMTKRELFLTCAMIGVVIAGVWEINRAIPVAAAPPLSTAVSIADPSNNGNQAGVDANGSIFNILHAGNGSAIYAGNNQNDAVVGTTSILGSLGFNYVWNGATWDRLRGTANAGMSVAPYGVNQVVVANASGIQANAAAVATLPGTAGKTTYIGGWRCTNNGATTPTLVTITVVGLLGGTTNQPASIVAAGSLSAIISETFTPAIPASAPNTAIVVTLPAAGAGNTFEECHAWGFQL